MVNEFSNNIHLFHNINPEMPHKKTSETHFSLNDFENYLNFGKELISNSLNKIPFAKPFPDEIIDLTIV